MHACIGVNTTMVEHNFTFTGYINRPALAAVLSILVVAAVIANTFVLIVTLYQKKSWKKPSTILFTSLIVSHLADALLYLPFFIIATATGEWVFGSTLEQKRGTCSFAAFMFFYNVLIITMTLAAISFDRFLFIVKPNIHKQFMKPWIVVTEVVAIWILSALLNTTPLYGLGEFDYDPTIGACGPAWTGHYDYLSYTLVIFSILLLIIAVTSVWTFCFTRKFLKNHSELADNVVYVSQRKKLVGIFAAMLLAYLLCYGPGYVIAILAGILNLPAEVFASIEVCFHSIIVTSPLVQSYFRPEIKLAIVFLYQKLTKTAATLSHIGSSHN